MDLEICVLQSIAKNGFYPSVAYEDPASLLREKGEISLQHPNARGGWKAKPQVSFFQGYAVLLHSSNPSTPPLHPTELPNVPTANHPFKFRPPTLPTQLKLSRSIGTCLLASLLINWPRMADIAKPPKDLADQRVVLPAETRPLYTLQNNPIEQMQKLHLTDFI